MVKNLQSIFIFSIFSPKFYIRLLLFVSIALSLFLTVYKNTSIPPCVNADEAAFGYSAYSILKTGADEYGHSLPVRLKSFGDHKMPLYSYLSVPFISVFGLNEAGTRSLNVVLAMLLPIAAFYLAKELFEKDEVGVIAALLVSVSLGLGIIERHAHEAILAVFLTTLAGYFFVRFIKTDRIRFGLLFIVSIFLSLFSYQSSRLFALFFLIYALIHFFRKKKLQKIGSVFIIVFVIALSIFAYTDIAHKPERVKNLFLTQNPGFTLKILELIREGGSRIVYNKLALGGREVVFQEMQYLSPQFLAIDGDRNLRFGFPGMSPMTPLEYIFIFIGLYFLFRNKERWRYFILSLLIISPLTSALSWAEGSLTRSIFVLIPSLITSAYGIYNLLLLAKKRNILPYVLLIFIMIESIFLYYSWNFYFNHYPKRAVVTRAWQCGYKELATYIKSNYDKYDTFYITKKNGEPYIFLLYFLKFPPRDYQKQASLTSPDEFGFGQVEKFDKFVFSIPSSVPSGKKAVLVGYPDDFNQNDRIDKSKIKKITIGKEDIFWIYEL